MRVYVAIYISNHLSVCVWGGGGGVRKYVCSLIVVLMHFLHAITCKKENNEHNLSVFLHVVKVYFVQKIQR